jgi:DNA-binding transcriptional MerR regulator
MNRFTIRDIENLCRIKAHTIRTWEQRYNLCVAKRKQSQHRVYNNEDLKDLLRVSFLYHHGHKISRIAKLSAEDIHEVVTCACNKNNEEAQVLQLLEAGLDLDKDRFEKTVNCLIMQYGMDKCLVSIFFPFLEKIGLLWLSDHVIPGQEHFVSHIIRKKILLATDGLERAKDRTAPPVVIFAPRGEHHEIPLLAVNYFFRKNGHRTVYFGPDLSLETLRSYLDEHRVALIYTHVITHINTDLESYLWELGTSCPGKKLFISGPAAASLEKIPANLSVIRKMEEMLQLAGSPEFTSA